MEETQKNRSRKVKNTFWFSPAYFIISLVYMELVFHIKEFSNISAVFPMLFAIPVGLVLGEICNLVPEKAARILRYVLLSVFAVWFCVQIVYYHSFQSFLSLSLLGMGGDVFTNFFRAIILAIWECLIPIILTFLPVIALPFVHKYIRPKTQRHIPRSVFQFIGAILIFVFVMVSLPLGGTSAHSAYANFHNNWVLDLSMEKLGVLTTTGLDLKYFMFGGLEIEGAGEEDVPVDVEIPENDQPVEVPETEENPYNVIEGLDFGALAETQKNKTVKKVMQYLDGLEPTKKNEYTGMFKDYNLILITAESFSPMAIHPELTPTLYMMSQSGFDFTNYWTTYPSNTTNGEYTNLTGLFPDTSKPKSNGSFVYSIRNTMNMNIANFFNAQGITSRAYHDHTAGYYKRRETHPNIGYTFKGKQQIGGLKGWPESDLIMMERTVGEYINDERFHTYYMTVSGHHNYRFGGYNSMVEKNKDLVQDLDYKDSGKAYIACHIELDKALEYLINALKQAGKLEKTVIVLTTDHYPYGLTDSSYANMLGHKIQYGGLERYKSDLFIWNSEMETIKVDKPCSQQDVLPTLLNLFGFNYDSRLYSGTDIFSDAPGLAIMTNQSFVTDKIIYNSRTEKVFKLDENWEMPEGYLDSYIQLVKNRFTIASNILNHDFYAKLPADVIAQAQRGTFTGEAIEPEAPAPTTPKKEKEEKEEEKEDGDQPIQTPDQNQQNPTPTPTPTQPPVQQQPQQPQQPIEPPVQEEEDEEPAPTTP